MTKNGLGWSRAKCWMQKKCWITKGSTGQLKTASTMNQLTLWEHQSTLNYNMPLRGLIYYAHNIYGILKPKGMGMYGKKLVKIPAPDYYVFYNGRENAPDRQDLSDSLSEAMDKAIDECVKKGLLKEYLLKKKAEVKLMLLTEFDEELFAETMREEGFEEGEKIGEKRARSALAN